MPPTTVAVAGSTGSIGRQTISVVESEGDRFEIVALAASGRDPEALAAQVAAVRPRIVAVADPAAESALKERVAELGGGTVEVRAGPLALESIALEAEVVVNGIVGFAGLGVTLATLNAGRRLALANKESLVAAGPVVQAARLTEGAELVPVDSEHGALHQCLLARGEVGGSDHRPVERLLLTASGGPFRGRSAQELSSVSLEEALAHPTWKMGPKISIDSSTLMNKGLEVIEAHELFGRPAGPHGLGIGLDAIEVVVHPQSVVHSMVEYSDGSTIAQLSLPDMRLPIGYALGWPTRISTPFGRIDWAQLGRLDFEAPDLEAFPCLGLAYQAAEAGGTTPAWLNAANEIVVEAVLDRRVAWSAIADALDECLQAAPGTAATDLDVVLETDRAARAVAAAVVARRTT